MRPVLLSDIEAAVRASWGRDTCAPGCVDSWQPGNPAFGQCGVTALVLNDLLGGDLIMAEVRIEGEFSDYHWWNRFQGVFDVDLTRSQFTPAEIVGEGAVVVRPPNVVSRCETEYRTLRRRVLDQLGLTDSGPL